MVPTRSAPGLRSEQETQLKLTLRMQVSNMMCERRAAP